MRVNTSPWQDFTAATPLLMVQQTLVQHLAWASALMRGPNSGHLAEALARKRLSLLPFRRCVGRRVARPAVATAGTEATVLFREKGNLSLQTVEDLHPLVSMRECLARGRDPADEARRTR